MQRTIALFFLLFSLSGIISMAGHSDPDRADGWRPHRQRGAESYRLPDCSEIPDMAAHFLDKIHLTRLQHDSFVRFAAGTALATLMKDCLQRTLVDMFFRHCRTLL